MIQKESLCPIITIVINSMQKEGIIFMVNCSFSTVRERDMDLLFLEAFASEPEFVQLVLEETPYAGKKISVLDAQLSRTELDLGESDITVILEIEGKRIALLIEDKIDAIAMPNQYGRYKLRGQKGIEKGEWQAFEIFIFCPKKYLQSNTESKKYDYPIFYEKFKNYFDTKGDPLSRVRSQQITQAISKSKKPPEANVDKEANAYFNQYLLFQQEHYPTLDLRTSKKSSGWWPHYGTRLGDVYLYHKTQEGTVILIFPNSTQYMDVMQEIASWLRMHGIPNVAAKTASSSLALSVEVPPLKVKEPFELTNKANLKACFDMIQELSDFANIVAAAYGISAIKKLKKK